MLKIVMFSFVGFASCMSKFQEMPQDSIVEEVAEFVIQKEVGIDVDLTPWSPEKEE